MCPDLGTGFIVRLGVNKGVGTKAPLGEREAVSDATWRLGVSDPVARTIVEILVIDKVSTPFESQAVVNPHLTQEPSVLLRRK
jgi:hypothetical protein